MNSSSSILINTVGVFSVTSEAGEVLTPVGSRPRALLAVIAFAPRKVAARRWLENLFWADRGPEQASGSLRQALTSIRRSLGEYSDVLLSDRLEVGLDASRVKIDLESEPNTIIEAINSGTAILEGFDVPTNTFEDWLRQTRTHWIEKVAASTHISFASPIPQKRANDEQSQIIKSIQKKPVLITETRTNSFQLEPFFAEAIGAQVARTATEHVNVSVISHDGEVVQAVDAPGARCIVRVTQNGSKILALAKLLKVPDGTTVWSRQIGFDASDDLAAIDAAASISLEATEAFASCISQASEAATANAYSMSALQHIFSFDPDRLKLADTLLVQAKELDQHAPRPALQALAKAFLSLETSVNDIQELKDQAQSLIRESLSIDPNNALALAFIADVHDLVLGDSFSALSYAERALQLDPGVGYAHASLGGLELKRGRHKEAFRSAGRAKRQLENTSLQVFSNMRYCLAAMNVGDFEAARLAAERASILAPNSCPPLRHLYVLNLHSGNIAGAKEALIKLQELEPEFSLEKIRNDPDYPADTIRRVGLDKLQDLNLD